MQNIAYLIFAFFGLTLLGCQQGVGFGQKKQQKAADPAEPEYKKSPRPETGNDMEFSFSDRRFGELKGKEIRYRIRFQGHEDIGKFEFDGSKGRIVMEDLQADAKGSLVTIDFMLTDEPILAGKAQNVSLKKGSNRRKVKDCRIRMVRWSGARSEGNCDWTVEF